MANVKCSGCGVELPREEMFGTPDDYRCPTCAQRGRQKYLGPKVKFVQKSFPVTVSIAVLAGATFAFAQKMLAADFFYANPIEVWNGQLWRLLTCVFPHGGLLHLAFNVYLLWVFGRAIETWMGSVRYVGFILVLAAGSGATQFLFDGPAIGLSGIGYGMFGFLFALRREKGFAAEVMQPQTVYILGLWFLACLFMPNIGNYAHGGGVLFGWLMGQAVLRKERVWLLGGIAALAVGLMAATLYMPWNLRYTQFRTEKAIEQGDEKAAIQWAAKTQELIRQGWRNRGAFPFPIDDFGVPGPDQTDVGDPPDNPQK